MKKNYFFITVMMTFLFSIFVHFTVKAQTPKKTPATPIICPANFEDINTKVNIAKYDKSSRLPMREAATAEILVTYGPGAQVDPEATDAIQGAFDIWSNHIVSPIAIKVYADFASLGSGVLASAGPSYFVSGVPNAPDENVLYPAALANAIAGEELFPDEEY